MRIVLNSSSSMAYNSNVKRFAATAYVSILALGTGIFIAEARPVYARKENQPCSYCHVRDGGGGDRGFRGIYYGGNGLSFDRFDEKREALIAGLSPNSEGRNTLPATSYNGNVSGPAIQQIQVASLRGPVVLIFLDRADSESKAAAKSMHSLAKALGPHATVLGIAKTDDAIKLSEALGSLIRVYSDQDLAAAKKFSADHALDIAVVAKLGKPIETLPGLSRKHITAALKHLPAVSFDLSSIPDKTLRGAKLGGT